MALFSTAAAFGAETPTLPTEAGAWGGILYLAVVCSGFGFTLQPVAQSKTTAQRAGMFCALSPAIAAFMGVLFLHEQMTAYGLAGTLLILASVLLPYLLHFIAAQKTSAS